jgi:hypothetical protein
MESELLQYGVFGLWTLFNLWYIQTGKQDFKELNDKLVTLVENNTQAMTQVYTTIQKCEGRK